MSAKPVVTLGVMEKCPACGSILVIRDGDRGLFIGCKAFRETRCKFTAVYSPSVIQMAEYQKQVVAEATKLTVDKFTLVKENKALLEENEMLYRRLETLDAETVSLQDDDIVIDDTPPKVGRPFKVYSDDVRVCIVQGWLKAPKSMTQLEYLQQVRFETGIKIVPRTLQTWLKNPSYIKGFIQTVKGPDTTLSNS